MSKKITLEEFQKRLTKKLGDSQVDARDVIKAFSESVRYGLEKDGKVRLSSIGYLELHTTDERKGRDPQTGDPIIIPSKTRVAFTPGKLLAEAVNKSYAHLEPKELEETPKGSTTVSFQSRFLRSKRMQVYKVRKPDPDYREINFRIPLAMLGTALFFAVLLSLTLQKPVKLTDDWESRTLEQIAHEDARSFQEQEQASNRAIEQKAYVEHRVQSGERLWTISSDYYDTPFWWPVIYSENQTKIPDFLLAEIPLRIPDMRRDENPEKAIALAYLELYKYYRDSEREASLDFLYAAYVFDQDVIRNFKDQISQEHINLVLAR